MCAHNVTLLLCPANHPTQCLPPPVSYHRLSPEKQQSLSSSPRTVNGEDSAESSRRPHGRSRNRTPRIRKTHSLEHRRCQDHNLASRINHKVNLNSLDPPCQEPRSRWANGPTTIASPLSCGDSCPSVRMSGGISMPSLRPSRSFSRFLGSPVFCIGWLAEGGSANPPTSGSSISSGTVTMSNWLPPSSLPLRASEPESPVGLRKSTEDAFPTSIRGSASAAARSGSLTRMTKGSPQHHRPRINPRQRPGIPSPAAAGTPVPGKVGRGCRSTAASFSPKTSPVTSRGGT